MATKNCGWSWKRSAQVCAVLVTMMATMLPALQVQQKPAEGAQQIAKLGQCKLESGQVIQDCQVGYRTYGHLDAARDNAVLFPTWYMGVSEQLKPNFAPDQLVDTTRFFGVALDALADGVSSSPSNSKQQHGTKFPQITIRDMVHAEYRVATEVLHLQHVHAVMGVSMGGIQTFAWAVEYPKYFDLAVPIVGSPRATSYDLLGEQTLLDAMVADPEYKGGNYTQEPVLPLANEILMKALTTPAYRVQHTSRAQYPAFLVEARKNGGMDANDRIWQLRALMRLDLTGKQSLADVAKKPGPKFLVVSAAQDEMVNPTPALAWAKAAGAQRYVSDMNCGHMIMECDSQRILPVVRAFLAQKNPYGLQ